MKPYWIKLAGRIDAMSLRERVLVFLMAAAVAIALINAVLISPLQERQNRLGAQMRQDEDRIMAIHAQVETLVKTGAGDADAGKRAQLDRLRHDVATSDEALRGMQKGLVQPDRMVGLLEDILRREGQLQLVSMKTLPVGGILDGDKKDADSAAVPGGPLVYKHGVELVVTGSYGDLLQYLARLESLPWQMFWGKVELKVEEYPRAALSLTLYTLSLDKTWLSI
ncbi:MAG: type II secretion system protein GspM [Sulfuricella sp.]|nr:type II secretion system protein GspM [Sulfuricella sp.]